MATICCAHLLDVRSPEFDSFDIVSTAGSAKLTKLTPSEERAPNETQQLRRTCGPRGAVHQPRSESSRAHRFVKHEWRPVGQQFAVRICRFNSILPFDARLASPRRGARDTPPGGDEDRQTAALFQPPMRAAWTDHRFPALLRRIGLEDYWRQSNTKPDFRA